MIEASIGEVIGWGFIFFLILLAHGFLCVIFWRDCDCFVLKIYPLFGHVCDFTLSVGGM